MMPNDFQVGQKVIYIPRHAHGDASHPDAEPGVVTSLGTDEGYGVVFVRFSPNSHGIACTPDSLYHAEPTWDPGTEGDLSGPSEQAT